MMMMMMMVMMMLGNGHDDDRCEIMMIDVIILSESDAYDELLPAAQNPAVGESIFRAL